MVALAINAAAEQFLSLLKSRFNRKMNRQGLTEEQAERQLLHVSRQQMLRQGLYLNLMWWGAHCHVFRRPGSAANAGSRLPEILWYNAQRLELKRKLEGAAEKIQKLEQDFKRTFGRAPAYPDSDLALLMLTTEPMGGEELVF